MQTHNRLALLILPLTLTVLCRYPSTAGAATTDPNIRSMITEVRADRIEATIRKLVGFGTRNTLSSQDDPNRGIGAARDYLFEEFNKIAAASNGRLTVEKQAFTQEVASRIPAPTRLTNIVATLKGTLPEDQQRVIVVSGHYDSMCTSPTDAVHDAPGANDDASGSAAVLEMARVMSRYTFRATIVFMCVPGEEQGLYGSAYFAQTARAGHLPIQAMFTNDIIGNSTGGNGVHDDHSVRVFSEGIPSDETETQARTRRSIGGENDGPSRQLARFIREAGQKYVHGMKVDLIYRRDRYLRGGDHISFLENGFPAVRFTEPNENYHHQHQDVRVENGVQFGDLPEFVDFAYVARVAEVNIAAIASMALAPASPSGTTLLTSRLTNDTDLRWNANREEDLAGYELVWRSTTDPDWTHARFLGKISTTTLPGMSKDNWLFGIRAVDKAGHKSVVSFPKPGR